MFPSNFAIYRKDQSSCHRGGVLLAVNMNIPSIPLPSPEDIEVVVVEVLSSKPFRICVVYNSPNSGLDYQRCLLSFMSTLLQEDGPIVLMGNFNTPDINRSTLSASSRVLFKFM